MYKSLIRPLFFTVDPEKIHRISFALIRFFYGIPGIKQLMRRRYRLEHPSLKRRLFGLDFSNPVGLAAGFDKNAELMHELSAFGFGFIEIGTVTPRPQAGNPKPRIFRLKDDQALINRLGFNNEGLEAIRQRLMKRPKNIIIGGNIGKNKDTPNERALDDYQEAFETLFDWVDYFVVNVSSPNTPNLRDLQDKEPLTRLLQSLQDLNQRKAQPKAILLKIAPDLSESQLDEIIEVVEDTKIAGLIASNTTLSRANLASDQKEVDSIGAGGLSGKPLQDRSTEVIHYLHQKSDGKIPIIGVGGVHDPKSAQEKLAAGASLVQLYTGFVYEGPAVVKRIKRSLIKN